MGIAATVATYATLLLAATIASARDDWTMTIYSQSGSHYTTSATDIGDIGCVTYRFNSPLYVSQAEFIVARFDDTFELYAEADCAGGASYTNGSGIYEFDPPIEVKSFQIY
jgi:hypothetical protein